MSISYYGHCRLAPHEAQRLIVAARAAHPALFDGPWRLSDARLPSEPFGAAISRDFGIAAQSWFTLDLIDKQAAPGLADEAIGRLHALFGPDDLIVTWHLDEVRPPRAG